MSGSGRCHSPFEIATVAPVQQQQLQQQQLQLLPLTRLQLRRYESHAATESRHYLDK